LINYYFLNNFFKGLKLFAKIPLMILKTAYLIIQEFPENEIEFVIGTKPFGIIWYDYEEALERYKEITNEWEIDSGKNNKAKPKLVRIELEKNN
jgi:hypothetical protein